MNLNDIAIDPKQPANINYTKARYAIEEAFKCRKDIRDAKMVVITHLNGTIRHPTEAQLKAGRTKQVIFPDNTKAKF